MNISFAILIHDEYEELDKLLSTIEPHMKENDEIVVVWDEPEDDEIKEKMEAVLEDHSIPPYHRKLDEDFAAQKNFLTERCEGDWIFNIDADEYPHEFLLKNLHSIVEKMTNDGFELVLVPRVNTVEGLTQEHVNKWGWRMQGKDPNASLSEKWVNWPDYQWRLYQNKDEIKWIYPVHEKITGFDKYGALPAKEKLSLYHPKTIERQERQNELYDQILDDKEREG